MKESEKETDFFFRYFFQQFNYFTLLLLLLMVTVRVVGKYGEGERAGDIQQKLLYIERVLTTGPPGHPK